jgi:hypothetical protein
MAVAAQQVSEFLSHQPWSRDRRDAVQARPRVVGNRRTSLVPRRADVPMRVDDQWHHDCRGQRDDAGAAPPPGQAR